ncbi:MAG: enoyl-CoA hydratase/isomerase family protein [Chloroflexi bacterium]|nr:enoyl-CoA hydratase/isomerase family protein [Chloroflexota bacterium]
MVAYKNISYEKKDQIGYLTLNRPDSGNSVNRAMADELELCCQHISQDDEVRVMVLTGIGDVFCTGGDIQNTSVSGVATGAIASLKMPVVAAINGDALGTGLELALACDMRLAATSANFGLTEVSNGYIPSGGGTQRLPRIVGRGKALEMVLTAAIIDAEEAYRIGLVNKVVPSDELTQTVQELATKIAAKGPISERYAKEAIGAGMDLTLGQGLGLEADLSFILQSTKDRAEGIAAFLEKRTPNFKGE